MTKKQNAFILTIAGFFLFLAIGCERPGKVIGDGVTDIDGNEYPTVIIGDQEWMAENLKTTKYNDGREIPNATGNLDWKNLNTGAYAWYNNDYDEFGAVYGALYNWYAVETGNLCPEGWRVPGDKDWKILEGTVDSEYNVGHSEWDGTGWRGKDAGKRLKAVKGWNEEGNGTDDHGFSALPGGSRFGSNGRFDFIHNYGNWWTATESYGNNAWRQRLYNNNNTSNRYNYTKQNGYSVRCLRDID